MEEIKTACSSRENILAALEASTDISRIAEILEFDNFQQQQTCDQILPETLVTALNCINKGLNIQDVSNILNLDIKGLKQTIKSTQIDQGCITKIMDTFQKEIQPFKCPIGKALIKQPVVAPDGVTYENDLIVKHLQISNISPFNNKPMQIDGESLKSNETFANDLKSFCLTRINDFLVFYSNFVQFENQQYAKELCQIIIEVFSISIEDWELKLMASFLKTAYYIENQIEFIFKTSCQQLRNQLRESAQNLPTDIQEVVHESFRQNFERKRNQRRMARKEKPEFLSANIESLHCSDN